MTLHCGGFSLRIVSKKLKAYTQASETNGRNQVPQIPCYLKSIEVILKLLIFIAADIFERLTLLICCLSVK